MQTRPRSTKTACPCRPCTTVLPSLQDPFSPSLPETVRPHSRLLGWDPAWVARTEPMATVVLCLSEPGSLIPPAWPPCLHRSCSALQHRRYCAVDQSDIVCLVAPVVPGHACLCKSLSLTEVYRRFAESASTRVVYLTINYKAVIIFLSSYNNVPEVYCTRKFMEWTVYGGSVAMRAVAEACGLESDARIP